MSRASVKLKRRLRCPKCRKAPDRLVEFMIGTSAFRVLDDGAARDAEEERRKVPTWSMLRTTLAEAEASLRVYTRRRMRDDAKVAPRG